MKPVEKCLSRNFIFLIFFVIFCVKSESIVVSNSHELEKLLCSDNTYEKSTTILLDTDITHKITSGKYCIVNISHSLTIASHSDDTSIHANINCVSSKKVHQHKWTSGFAFHGIGSLIIRRLGIANCGTNFTALDSSIINSTTFRIYFTHNHAAALIFAVIPRLQLDNVSIFQYIGFAIISVNLPNALFHSLHIFFNKPVSIGSGVLFLFYNQKTLASVSDYSLSISKSTFFENHASIKYQNFLNKLHCVSEIYKNSSCMPVVSAGGLTILYTQTDARATVTLSNNTFQLCSGHLAGAILIVRFNSSVDSKTIIKNSRFDSNSIVQYCHGAAIAAVLYFDNNELNTTYKPLAITNVTFSSNGFSFNWNSGAIDIAVINVNNVELILHPKIELIFRKLLFHSNFAFNFGACMFAAVYPDSMANFVHMLFESVIAYNNPNIFWLPQTEKYILVSLFYLSNIHVTINGTIANPGNFSYNYGSVFVIMNSNVYLEGHLYFDSNIGHNGAALLLKGDSYLYLKKGLSANFSNNAVQSLGGAICATGASSFHCTIQLLSNDTADISLNFINNTAELAGNAIYSTRLYECSIIKGTFVENLTHYYSTIIKNASLTDISSVAEKISFCNPEQKYEVYPGGTIHIPISVYDYNNSPTFAVIIVEESDSRKVNWWFSDSYDTFVIKKNCTVINLKVNASDVSTRSKSSLFLFTITEENKVIAANVLLKKCPLGFQLDSNTGTCICSDIIKQKLSCNISSITFRKPSNVNIWLGTDQTGRKLFVGYCNPSYCNIGSQFDTLHFNTTGSYLSSSETSKTMPLCFGSRKGILCGECITNYSVVFGSSECKMCSNKWWPLTSIIYILAGPLLVFLLYTLKLTLATGTLNGIIFYAQVANLGYAYLNMPCNEECANEYFFVKFSNALLSLLNLNIGFPICLYDGMTELWKAGLSLFFPIYLILIIGFLIILCHFSTKVSNKLAYSSVQVLTTVVHLSFTRLLETFIEVFSAGLYHEDGVKEPKRVWYNSGAVEYASMEHKCLMIVTSSIVGLILIPYLVLIFFGKFIMKVDKFREYIRPLYEAVHAPYKTNKWYWFSFQQIILLLIYAIATLEGAHPRATLIVLIMSVVFLYLQLCSMPFKNKISNVLNCFFILNLIITFMAAQYIHLTGGSPKYLVFFFASANYPVFIIFGFIIIYHILLSTKQLGKAHYLYKNIAACFVNKELSHQQNY